MSEDFDAAVARIHRRAFARFVAGWLFKSGLIAVALVIFHFWRAA
jgi:hypothetical protein